MMYLSLSISLSLYIYIYICNLCIYIYIYIYQREREGDIGHHVGRRTAPHWRRTACPRGPPRAPRPRRPPVVGHTRSPRTERRTDLLERV